MLGRWLKFRAGSVILPGSTFVLGTVLWGKPMSKLDLGATKMEAGDETRGGSRHGEPRKSGPCGCCLRRMVAPALSQLRDEKMLTLLCLHLFLRLSGLLKLWNTIYKKRKEGLSRNHK